MDQRSQLKLTISDKLTLLIYKVMDQLSECTRNKSVKKEARFHYDCTRGIKAECRASSEPDTSLPALPHSLISWRNSSLSALSGGEGACPGLRTDALKQHWMHERPLRFTESLLQDSTFQFPVLLGSILNCPQHRELLPESRDSISQVLKSSNSIHLGLVGWETQSSARTHLTYQKHPGSWNPIAFKRHTLRGIQC